MKSTPSDALVSAGSFDERLRNVFSLREATPVLNEYLSSIQIDDENPGFVLSWDLDNLNAFVAAANAQIPARAPAWLRSQRQPPQIDVNSFTDDLVQELLQKNDDFMQEAARAAFDDAERYIATTYCLMDTKAQRSTANNLPRPSRNNQPLRRIFI